MRERLKVMGNSYGYWTVIGESEPRLYNRGSKTVKFRSVTVRCVCGITRSVVLQNLTQERSKSCGCRKKDMISKAMKGRRRYSYGTLRV